MILTNTRGVYYRTQFKHFVKYSVWSDFLHKYNRQTIADLYDTIGHPDIPPDRSLKRIIVMPPGGAREVR